MYSKLYLITVPTGHKGATICAFSRRHFSQEVKTIRSIDPSQLKRGTGGRSSFSGNVITIFGATGYLGRFLCANLAKRGSQLIIPHRRGPDDSTVKALKVCGDLGQILFQQFSLKDPASIKKAIKYSNIVINLIGREFETSNFSGHDVHVKGAKAIAEACREMNVERLIHFSALNLTENPQRYYVKKLNFLKHKLEGECAVLEEFPEATIVRPSNIYGFKDKFLWPLCIRRRCFFDSVPLYANGMETIKQPVYYEDVTNAVSALIDDYSTRGKIYQAVGPERYLLKDISVFCSQVLQRHHFSSSLTHDIKYNLLFLAKIIFYREIFEMPSHMPVRHLSFEFIERESVTDVVDPNLPVIGNLIPLTKFEDVVPNLIYKTFRKYPAMAISCENYLPPESLSGKAINEFSF